MSTWNIDTTGLLLLNNNGPLAHALLSPQHPVGFIKSEGLMMTEDVEVFSKELS
nr:hypothetical protein [Streptococcus sp. ZJ373]